MWQTDRSTSGTRDGDGQHDKTRRDHRSESLFVPFSLRGLLEWLLRNPFGELILMVLPMAALIRFIPRWPESLQIVVVFAFYSLSVVWSTRTCYVIDHRYRFFVYFVLLLPLGVFSIGVLPAIPLGANGRADWFLLTITTSGILAVPLFLVTTGFIRLPRRFWWFTVRQLAGFATATAVLLVFLGAYSREVALFTPYSTFWQVFRSFGQLLVQGVRCLMSGASPGADATTADVLVYMTGWIVFALIAGVEVSIVAERASKEMDEIEWHTRSLRRLACSPRSRERLGKRLARSWRYLRSGEWLELFD
jgi:hypothetical protein